MFAAVLVVTNRIIFLICLLRQGFGFLRHCVWKYFPLHTISNRGRTKLFGLLALL